MRGTRVAGMPPAPVASTALGPAPAAPVAAAAPAAPTASDAAHVAAAGPAALAASDAAPVAAAMPAALTASDAAPVAAAAPAALAASDAAPAAAVDAPVVSTTSDSKIGHLLVSVASEDTGRAQTCRDELFALFGIWFGRADTSLSKSHCEADDKVLRDEARRMYVHELLQQGVIVEYANFANGKTGVTVSWDGVKMHREVKKEKGGAARSAFVALLRKRVQACMSPGLAWPFPDRPQTDPGIGGRASLPVQQGVGVVDSATLEAQMQYAFSSGPARPAAPAGAGSTQFTPSQASSLAWRSGARGRASGTAAPAGAARASGGAGRGSAAAKAQAVPIEFDETFDLDAFRQYAEQMADAVMKNTTLHRLYELFQLIHDADAPVEHRQMDQKPENNCVLGFSLLEVKQPEFNNEIRELVKTNKIWHGLSGSRELKKPTWVVYELLRQIGVRPQKHCRGPKEHDPDPKDFMYATRYIFCRRTLLNNRHRLQVSCHAFRMSFATCVHHA